MRVTAAPEWKIADWTDGKNRKLSDYRGQVVVLDFWGTWCGPCIRAFPAMKALQERYKDRKVVFLGLHTAGTDMSLVKRVLQHEQRDVAVGLDAGDSIETGETVNRYAITDSPTVVIIDPKGNIAYNDADKPDGMQQHLREMKSLAESAGVPWPVDKNATEAEALERLKKLQVYRYTQQIDRASMRLGNNRCELGKAMFLRIEKGSAVPISRQIADQIATLCASGGVHPVSECRRSVSSRASWPSTRTPCCECTSGCAAKGCSKCGTGRGRLLRAACRRLGWLRIVRGWSTNCGRSCGRRRDLAFRPTNCMNFWPRRPTV